MDDPSGLVAGLRSITCSGACMPSGCWSSVAKLTSYPSLCALVQDRELDAIGLGRARLTPCWALHGLNALGDWAPVVPRRLLRFNTLGQRAAKCGLQCPGTMPPPGQVLAAPLLNDDETLVRLAAVLLTDRRLPPSEPAARRW